MKEDWGQDPGKISLLPWKILLSPVSMNHVYCDSKMQVLVTLAWGASRGGSSGLFEPPKMNHRKYFDHTFSCEKRTCFTLITIREM